MKSSPDVEPFVVGVTATFRRPEELKRLLTSLPDAGPALRALVVVDNAGDAVTHQLCNESPIPVEYHAPGSNLGCGGGLHTGERLALEKFGGQLTHLWILDDDAVIMAGALDTLLDAMAQGDADAVYPLVVDAEGQLGWFPGLTEPEKFRAVRQPQTPEQFVASCSDEPVPFSWCPGVALLVSRRALDEFGLHRTDYWVRGEDLEYSLRITHQRRGLYVPRARVLHLPPPMVGEVLAQAEYAKHRAMLQNVAYTSLRMPHGRRIVWTIPGNWFRFLRTWGFRPRVLADGFRTLWTGAVRGWPAGHLQADSARR